MQANKRCLHGGRVNTRDAGLTLTRLSADDPAVYTAT